MSRLFSTSSSIPADSVKDSDGTLVFEGAMGRERLLSDTGMLLVVSVVPEANMYKYVWVSVTGVVLQLDWFVSPSSSLELVLV